MYLDLTHSGGLGPLGRWTCRMGPPPSGSWNKSDIHYRTKLPSIKIIQLSYLLELTFCFRVLQRVHAVLPRFRGL